MKSKNSANKKLIQRLVSDGKYADWWSLAHLLFGMLVAFIIKPIGLLFFPALMLGLFVFISWEIVEPILYKKIKIKFLETKYNQILDIVFGTAGFLLYWFL